MKWNEFSNWTFSNVLGNWFSPQTCRAGLVWPRWTRSSPPWRGGSSTSRPEWVRTWLFALPHSDVTDTSHTLPQRRTRGVYTLAVWYGQMITKCKSFNSKRTKLQIKGAEVFLRRLRDDARQCLFVVSSSAFTSLGLFTQRSSAVIELITALKQVCDPIEVRSWCTTWTVRKTRPSLSHVFHVCVNVLN